jgi:hypothetical protein
MGFPLPSDRAGPSLMDHCLRAHRLERRPPSVERRLRFVRRHDQLFPVSAITSGHTVRVRAMLTVLLNVQVPSHDSPLGA